MVVLNTYRGPQSGRVRVGFDHDGAIVAQLGNECLRVTSDHIILGHIVGEIEFDFQFPTRQQYERLEAKDLDFSMANQQSSFYYGQIKPASDLELNDKFVFNGAVFTVNSIGDHEVNAARSNPLQHITIDKTRIVFRLTSREDFTSQLISDLVKVAANGPEKEAALAYIQQLGKKLPVETPF